MLSPLLPGIELPRLLNRLSVKCTVNLVKSFQEDSAISCRSFGSN